MGLRNRRRLAFLIALGFVLASCGDAGLLDGLGARSQDAVRGSTTTSTTLLVTPGDEAEMGVKPTVDARWENDRISDQFEGGASYVIQGVWSRRPDDATRFIQASRLEIANALPDVRFPSVIPEDVRAITSQLVYDTSSGLLDVDTSAAFGLWAVRPYEVPEGRLAVLRVGPFEGNRAAVSREILDDRVADGLSLNWFTGAYRYELFCRDSLPEDLCWEMAESSLPLGSQLPVPVTAVDGSN